MASSPPGARESTPPLLLRLNEAAFRAGVADEGILFFCVEDAPREACRTRSCPDGSLTFETCLEGTVIDASPGELRLSTAERSSVVRHLLPSALELSPLRGQLIRADVTQRYLGRGRATIDAELRDAEGRVLLWAHDGRTPPDQLGLAFRRTVDADGHRLAVGHLAGVSSVSAGDVVRVRCGIDPFDLAVLRVGADDVSFVLLRR